MKITLLFPHKRRKRERYSNPLVYAGVWFSWYCLPYHHGAKLHHLQSSKLLSQVHPTPLHFKVLRQVRFPTNIQRASYETLQGIKFDLGYPTDHLKVYNTMMVFDVSSTALNGCWYCFATYQGCSYPLINSPILWVSCFININFVNEFGHEADEATDGFHPFLCVFQVKRLQGCGLWSLSQMCKQGVVSCRKFMHFMNYISCRKCILFEKFSLTDTCGAWEGDCSDIKHVVIL